MIKTMATIEAKYKAILSKEQELAKAVAGRVIKLPELTAWSLIIPIIFVFNLIKYQRTKEIFILNLLFTKKLALEGAFDILKKGLEREEVIDRISLKTEDILEADKKGIYSEKIRTKQLYEINLLIDHYSKLLEAEGKDYRSLIRNAYPSLENYKAFLKQLAEAERAVNRAALQTIGKTQASREIVSKMEEAIEELRARETEEIFK